MYEQNQFFSDQTLMQDHMICALLIGNTCKQTEKLKSDLLTE